MSFQSYNPDKETDKSRRFLPHWEQLGCTYFITWRMADAMPAAKLREWQTKRDQWLQHHPKPWNDATWKHYHDTFETPMQKWLDAGHGSCALNDPALREIIVISLHHYDSQRYELQDYVIMPNHVHVLFTPLPEHPMRESVAAWKRFTGHAILKHTSGAAPFWLEEWFDHIVRSPAQMDWYRRYIRDNPAKAFLKEGQWTHWSAEDTVECGSAVPAE